LSNLVDRLSKLKTPGRLLLFLGMIVLLWVPFASIWLFGTGWTWGKELTNTQNIGTTVLLYLTIPTVLWGFSKFLDHKPFSQYGLVRDRRNFLGFGLGLSLGSVLYASLLLIQGAFGWITFDLSHLQTAGPLPLLLLTGFVEGVGIAFMEELLFRGFLVNQFGRDYGLTSAQYLTSLVFAVTHFIRPLDAILATWPQFLGLWAFGLVLVYCRWWTNNRLGLGIGFHGGCVWVLVLVNSIGLVKYTGTISPLVTGVTPGNPLTGFIGLFFLGISFIVLWAITRQLGFQKSEH
jgi:membrane protease YdiL (CAAX protease family)